MKVKDINNYNSEKFIDSFKNIYEESKFITEDDEKKRPFKNKKEMILVFLELFDNLDEETKRKLNKRANFTSILLSFVFSYLYVQNVFY